MVTTAHAVIETLVIVLDAIETTIDHGAARARAVPAPRHARDFRRVVLQRPRRVD